ncbi:MAG TPA: MotA/TolQ/ExbB proton channel family protein [Candidatus Ozemobacteraceae bacterium]|nr:MotA/TolQ/ExbB proton channel family protein [Candidatus Ozemobacteraceae bacterium]
MERSTIIGFFGTWVLLLIGIKLAGPIVAFIDYPSIMIVLGCTTVSCLVAYPFQEVKKTFGMMLSCFKESEKFDYAKSITDILAISEVARKEGLLSLDTKLNEIQDPFMVRILRMVVDSIDNNIISDVIQTEIDSRGSRHEDTKTIIEFMASVGPAYGMVGTLIGLVLMLRDLNDPSTIGPNMAVALVTTFYGSLLANLCLTPFIKKLVARSQAELLHLEIIGKGCQMIAAGVHPRIISERLVSYLPTKERAKVADIDLERKTS